MNTRELALESQVTKVIYKTNGNSTGEEKKNTQYLTRLDE